MKIISNEYVDGINSLQDLFKICCKENNELTAIKIRNKDEIKEISYKKAWSDACGIAEDIIERGFIEEYIPLLGSFSYGWLVFYMAVTISGNIVVPFESANEDLYEKIEELNIKTIYADSKIIKKGTLKNRTELIYSVPDSMSCRAIDFSDCR